MARLSDIPVDEIIVSDNASTDETPLVIKKAMKRDKRIRAVALPEHDIAYANIRNALKFATGEHVVYLADDDSLLAEPLAVLRGRMDSDPSLSAVFTDSIAWDDVEQRELHRYFPPGMEPVEFEPDNSLGLLNFCLQTMLPPELGIYNRKALVKALVPYSTRHLSFHLHLFNLSRLGKVRFDPTAFYREHRVSKFPHDTENLTAAYSYIGDEQRLGLEQFCLLCIDAANLTPNPQMLAQVHTLISLMLHTRTDLEVERAISRGDYQLAVALRRRQTLWHGPSQRAVEDFERIVKPAAEQALKLYEGWSDAPTLDELIDTYRILRPGITVSQAAE